MCMLSTCPMHSCHFKFFCVCLDGDESGESSGSNSSEELGSSGLNSPNCSTIQCSDGFYCSLDATTNISTCRPRCDTWEQYPRSTVIILSVCAIPAGIIGFTAAVAALVITCLRWKQV